MQFTTSNYQPEEKRNKTTKTQPTIYPVAKEQYERYRIPLSTL